MKSWLNPALSMETELHRENDRRIAARMSRDELNMLADRLICQCYHQHVVIEQSMRRVTTLEVEAMLAQSKPTPVEPDRRHFQWARELLGKG